MVTSTHEQRVRRRAYWARNKDELNRVRRAHRSKHVLRFREQERARHDNDRCRARRASAYRARYARDPAFRLKELLRRSMHDCLRRRKSQRTMHYVGCTPEELCSHIERLFQPGMSWENMGRDWHIDHIRPIASFDFSSEDALNACHSYRNLQPLWAAENLKKGSLWEGVRH